MLASNVHERCIYGGRQCIVCLVGPGGLHDARCAGQRDFYDIVFEVVVVVTGMMSSACIALRVKLMLAWKVGWLGRWMLGFSTYVESWCVHGKTDDLHMHANKQRLTAAKDITFTDYVDRVARLCGMVRQILLANCGGGGYVFH